MNRQPGRVRVVAVGFFLFIGIFLLAGLGLQSPVGAEADKGRSLGLFHIYHYDIEEDESGNPVGELLIALQYEARRFDEGDDIYRDEFLIMEDEWRKTGNPKLIYRRTTYKGLIPIAFHLEIERYNEERENLHRAFYEYSLDYPEIDLEAAYETLLTTGAVEISYSGERRFLSFYCPEQGPCEKAAGNRLEERKADLGGTFEFKLTGELASGGVSLIMVRNGNAVYCYDPDRQFIVGQSAPDVHFLTADLMRYFQTSPKGLEVFRSSCLRSDGKPIG